MVTNLRILPILSLGTLLLLLAKPTTAQTQTDGTEPHQYVKTTMCTTQCDDTSQCKAYITPLDQCFNAQHLFPGDSSWSQWDIKDTMSMESLKRTFYKSTDGSCSLTHEAGDLVTLEEFVTLATIGEQGVGEEEDSFILPFDVCVGPFGPPRPWGKFSLGVSSWRPLVNFEEVGV